MIFQRWGNCAEKRVCIVGCKMHPMLIRSDWQATVILPINLSSILKWCWNLNPGFEHWTFSGTGNDLIAASLVCHSICIKILFMKSLEISYLFSFASWKETDHPSRPGKHLTTQSQDTYSQRTNVPIYLIGLLGYLTWNKSSDNAKDNLSWITLLGQRATISQVRQGLCKVSSVFKTKWLHSPCYMCRVRPVSRPTLENPSGDVAMVLAVL